MLLMGFLKPSPRGVFSYNCCSEKPFRLIIEEKRWQLHCKTVGKGVLYHASRQKLLVSDVTQHAEDPVSLSGLVTLSLLRRERCPLCLNSACLFECFE